MEISGSFLHELFKCVRWINSRFDKLFKEADLTLFQFINLYFINKFEGQCITQVADIIGINRSTLSKNCDILIRRGLLIKKVSGVRDKRKSLILLTEKGRDVLYKGESVWERFVGPALIDCKLDFLESLNQKIREYPTN